MRYRSHQRAVELFSLVLALLSLAPAVAGGPCFILVGTPDGQRRLVLPPLDGEGTSAALFESSREFANEYRLTAGFGCEDVECVTRLLAQHLGAECEVEFDDAYHPNLERFIDVRMVDGSVARLAFDTSDDLSEQARAFATRHGLTHGAGCADAGCVVVRLVQEMQAARPRPQLGASMTDFVVTPSAEPDGESRAAAAAAAIPAVAARARSPRVLPVFQQSETRRIAECAANHTVLMTSVNARYTPQARRLARSVWSVGEFPALLVVVQGDAFLDELNGEPTAVQMRLEPLVQGALSPEPLWCTNASWVDLWGWRRTHLYKVSAYHLLLSRGFNVLTVDADWIMSSPAMSRIEAARADVVGYADVPQPQHGGGQYVNFGLHWTRSTDATVRMAWRVQNRTSQGWDQFVWNVEIAGSSEVLSRCCASGATLNSSFDWSKSTHDMKRHIPSTPRCHAHERALMPPEILPFDHPRWSASEFNTEGMYGSRIFNPCVKQMCPLAPLAPGTITPLTQSLIDAAWKGDGDAPRDFTQRVAGLQIAFGREAAERSLSLLRHESVNASASIHLLAGGEPWSDAMMQDFAFEIYRTHNRLPAALFSRSWLHSKWSHRTLIGEVDVWELLQLLHFTVDHSDGKLHYTSQFIHCLQVFNGIRAASFGGVDAAFKRDLEVAALIHDLGKLLSLIGNEEEHHVDCMNRVIGPLPTTGPPVGLANIPIQWNHDEYGYQKLAAVRPKLPERVLASVRFHSLREATGETRHDPDRAWAGLHVTQADIDEFNRHLTDNDRELMVFVLEMRKFDYLTKERTSEIPAVDVKYIRALLLQYFPPNGAMVW